MAHVAIAFSTALKAFTDNGHVWAMAERRRYEESLEVLGKVGN